MADELDFYGPEDPRGMDHESRQRFLRDVLFYMRVENDKARTELRSALVEFEKRIDDSRPVAVEKGILRCLEVEAEDVPEVRAILKRLLQSRRDRRERVAELWSVSRGIAFEVFKHAIVSAIFAGAAYYGWSEWLK